MLDFMLRFRDLRSQYLLMTHLNPLMILLRTLRSTSSRQSKRIGEREGGMSGTDPSAYRCCSKSRRAASWGGMCLDSSDMAVSWKREGRGKREKGGTGTAPLRVESGGMGDARFDSV